MALTTNPRQRVKGRIIFVTGTDTNVGKTVFTLNLVRSIKRTGARVAALKPFCTGHREDAIRLWKEAESGLSLDEVNPYYYRKALAPINAGKPTNKVTLAGVLRHIATVSKGYDITVIEGVGGIHVPLQKGLILADIIEKLECELVVVGRNALGTLNHTLLTVLELKRRGKRINHIVLSDFFPSDASRRLNRKTLMQCLPGERIAIAPKMTDWPEMSCETASQKRIFQKTLATISRVSNVWTRRCDVALKRKRNEKSSRQSGTVLRK